MSGVDRRVTGLNQVTFKALQEIKKPKPMTQADAAKLQSAILKDGNIDAAEQDLLTELTSDGKQMVNISAAQKADFHPKALNFAPVQGAVRTSLQTLSQIGPRFGDPDQMDEISLKEQIKMAADLTGIVDPLPTSDAISAVISASDGDWTDVALSVGSMIPYFGDAVSKPAKFLKKIIEDFPHLGRVLKSVDDIPRLFRTLDKLGPGLKNPSIVMQTLSTLNNMHKAAEAAYHNVKFLEYAKSKNLPTDGPIPFVPPARWNLSNPVRTADRKGYIDDFGNEWRPGNSRTAGEATEWDVVPRSKNSGIARLSRDGSHVNVSLQGDVSHR